MDLKFPCRASVLFKAAAVLGGAATLAACATAPTTVAVAPSAPAMALSARTAPPQGYLAFCQREPEACAPAGSHGRIDTAEAGEIRRTAGRILWRTAFSSDSAKPAALPGAALPSPALPSPSIPTPAPRSPALSGPGPAETATADVETLSVAPANDAAPSATVEASGAPVIAPVTVTASSFSPPALTDALWAELKGVNLRVNAAIKSASDQEVYGVADYWALPLKAGGPARGDCEDYVLEKRRALVDDGLPEAALSIAIVTTRWGESHAVLLVATDKGELVLDSLNPEVVFWNRAAYAWNKRQVQGEAFDWAEIASAPPTKIASAQP